MSSILAIITIIWCRTFGVLSNKDYKKFYYRIKRLEKITERLLKRKRESGNSFLFRIRTLYKQGLLLCERVPSAHDIISVKKNLVRHTMSNTNRFWKKNGNYSELQDGNKAKALCRTFFCPAANFNVGHI